MDWLAVTVDTSSEAVDAVSNMLMELGAEGTQIDDAADFTHETISKTGVWLDPSTIRHRQHGAAVTGYFPPKANAVELKTTLSQRVAQLPSFGLPLGKGTVTMNAVASTNWASEWKKYYHPARITRFLTIVPEWSKYQPQQPNEQIIRLDPGEAFGTGTHPTTQLMLQLLEASIRGGEDMIDVGTGSGILAIAARLLGVEHVLATDVDDIAVKNAQSNIALNPVDNIQAQASDLLSNVSATADLIVANILAEVLLPLIPQLPAHLKPHGTVLLSGIFHDKVTTVTEKLAAAGFTVHYRWQSGDWYGLAARPTNEESE